MLAVIGLGAAEIVVLGFLCLLFFGLLGLAIGGLAYFLKQAKGDSTPGPAAAAPAAVSLSQPIDAAQSSADVVASITKRFCPQCRAALGGDSPEGLCAACLLAGGLEAPAPLTADGLAMTTPPSGSQPPVTSQVPADLAKHFPQLEILELLGRGGMGAVYKARQKNLDRIVALKVIPPEAAKDPAFAERFAREARALARLNHANIVTVHDFGQAGEIYFLIMEFVDGVNLRQALRAGRLSPREALAIVPQICDALQYAHDQGIVHRDIKPENVLLDRAGRVKIADFGLAKLLVPGSDDFTLTQTRQVMGTPRYMAPEQFERPTEVDHRADIYSLGVVIYEMLTGEMPIGRFPLPSEKVQIDVRIDQVVLRTLEKEPARRYQRASQVKSELASAGGGMVSAGMGISGSQAELGSESVAARGSTPPTWQTPAPATKSDPTLSPPPGGVPLGMVLGVAIGMVLGILLMSVGAFAIGYAILEAVSKQLPLAGPFWGWMGAGFGCLAGGFGSVAGSYNSYRQMAGAEDLLRSPRTTWLDWVLRGYLVLGVVLIVAGLWDYLDGYGGISSSGPLFLLGAITCFQAGLFLLWRTVVVIGQPRLAGDAAPLDPRREAIRRRVAGPAIGLMVVGLVGLIPTLLAMLMVPTVVLFGPGDQIHEGPRMTEDMGTKAAYLPTPAATLAAALAAPTFALTSPIPFAPFVLAQPEAAPGMVETPVGIAWAGILFLVFILASTIPAVLLIVAGWRMRKLRSHGLASVAAVIAVLPCTAGWLLGIPIGIWALVVLMRPEVVEVFES
ncbi:MAG: serine/threonine-protein kinase [Pirellulaceae bacterium]|nr:serine/threonine-protein kinase [Pirellulaceae bacterium]